jgi:hypothetical protein
MALFSHLPIPHSPVPRLLAIDSVYQLRHQRGTTSDSGNACQPTIFRYRLERNSPSSSHFLDLFLRLRPGFSMHYATYLEDLLHSLGIDEPGKTEVSRRLASKTFSSDDHNELQGAHTANGILFLPASFRHKANTAPLSVACEAPCALVGRCG